MPGFRKLTSPALALLCLTFSGPVAHSAGPIVDEEDVVVKPKGGNVPKGGDTEGIAPYGFAWLHGPNHDYMKKGNAKQFRCDLYRHLYTLQVKKTSADPYEPADAVHFILEGKEFGVTKSYGGKYIWYNLNDSPTACNNMSNKCSGNGVPPEFMDAKAEEGTIWARLEGKGDWTQVVEVFMRGKKCD
jgi:hypothetical protein